MLKHIKPSVLLILLTIVSLLFGLVLLILVTSSESNLAGDARLINQLGFIRGNIQYISKIALVEPNRSLSDEYEVLETAINEVRNNQKFIEHTELYQPFLTELTTLSEQWDTLKTNLQSYQQNPNRELALLILQQSNSCWFIAVKMVLAAQIAAENQADRTRLLLRTIFFIIFISALVAIVLDIYLVRNRLERQSMLDGLTGARNRRSFNSISNDEIKRSLRYQSPLSMILFDIDLFKQVNDQWGHLTGDDVLKILSTLVTESIRKSDTLFRVGGEEFAILCPQTDLIGALALAELIRKKVEHHRFPIPESVTISLGVSQYHAQLSEAEFYDLADQALYKAKSAGRNCAKILPAPEKLS
jgi:diguanylate cyclase (GGDEF)-like protein